MEENLQRFSLKEIAQSPIAYAFYVVTIVLMGVIGSQRLDLNKERSECADELKTARLETKAERLEKDQVFKAYLAERMANEAIQKIVDSTAKQKNSK